MRRVIRPASSRKLVPMPRIRLTRKVPSMFFQNSLNFPVKNSLRLLQFMLLMALISRS